METIKRSLLDCEEKLGWNPSLRVEIVPEEGVYLFAETGNVFLRGEIYPLLAPLLLEATSTADELADLLKEKTSSAEIYYAITRLEKLDLVQEMADVLPERMAAFCGLLKVPVSVAFQRLHAAKIFVQSFAGAIDPQFFSTLENWGMTLVETTEQADFSVIFVEDYLQPELPVFNRSAFARKHPWLPVRAVGSQIWIGPFFNSGHAGCHECLARRLKTNRLEESWVQQKKGLSHLFPPAQAMLSTTEKWALNFAATEIFKRVVTGKSDALADKVLTFDVMEPALKEHFLTRLPFCGCCSETPSDPGQCPSPLVLLPVKKGRDNDGGYHCFPYEETLEKYSAHISPITGVVQFLESSPNVSRPSMHVYVGGNNRAVPDKHQGKNIKNFRSACGGKGTTQMQAKVGCLCESIERFSGEFQGDERRIQSSWLELKDKAIHPKSVLLYSQQQYLLRDKINRQAHRFHWVPAPFSEDMLLEWSPIWSLTEQIYKYYPTALCYYSYPAEKNRGFFRSDSNGCAAGNCIEEAILQGFLELVERDSVALWWYNRLHRAEIDLKSFQNPFMTSLLEEYAQKGREVWVLDITSDLGIPSFTALSRLKNSAREMIFFGFGAHLDPMTGIIRALTEMNQFLASEPFWEKPTFGDGSAQVERDWFQLVTVENQPWLKGAATKSASDFPKWESANLLEDIKHCRHRVESQGMEVLVLDQTRQEIGLSVVKVIVPGLRHFWPRFAPGRLYDVPVKMQWVKEPLKESELNPIGMFL